MHNWDKKQPPKTPLTPFHCSKRLFLAQLEMLLHGVTQFWGNLKSTNSTLAQNIFTPFKLRTTVKQTSNSTWVSAWMWRNIHSRRRIQTHMQFSPTAPKSQMTAEYCVTDPASSTSNCPVFEQRLKLVVFSVKSRLVRCKSYWNDKKFHKIA